MSVKYHIDDDNKLVTMAWIGEEADGDFIDLIKEHQINGKDQPGYLSYNEILDFRKISNIKLSGEGIMNLDVIGKSDGYEELKTKLAIIVSSDFAFRLARMYAIYRGFLESAKKEIRVYKKMSEAIEWINDNP